MNKGALLLVLVLSMPIVLSLSTPITVPVIVKLGNDKAIIISVSTLKKHLPNAIVINFGTLEYYLVIWRAHNIIFWVGHGSTQGIRIKGDIIPWRILANRVVFSPAYDIIVSCYSTEIYKFLRRGVFAVSQGLLDAKLGALLALYFLGYANSENISKYIIGLLNGSFKFMPLLCFGEKEAIFDGLNFLLLVLATIFTAAQIGKIKTPLKEFVIKNINKFLALTSAFVAVIGYFLGYATFQVAVTSFFTAIVPLIVDAFIYAISKVDWLTRISMVATFFAKFSNTAGQVETFISLIMLITGWILWVIGFWSDLFDDDYNMGPQDDVSSFPWEVL